MPRPPSRTLALALVIGAAAPAAVLAQSRRVEDDQDYRQRIDTSFAFGRAGIIDLTQISGDIVITGTSRDEVRIKAYSERGRIRFDVSSTRVMLDAEPVRGRMGDSRYELSVPANSRVIARSTSGDVSVQGVTGPVEAHSVSGDVEVTDAGGRVQLESVSGEVRGSHLAGDVRAEAVSGSVTLEQIDGDVRVESTSGDISVTRVRSKSLYVSTVNGDVEFDGSIDPAGRYELHSHSGDVRLEIPDNASARFAIETYSGSFDTDFTVTLQPGDTNRRRPRRFEFTVGSGSGGARVTVESFSGDITLGRSRSSR
jgi:DUF4097 and DUF4098 domain-containing protein YvlB